MSAYTYAQCEQIHFGMHAHYSAQQLSELRTLLHQPITFAGSVLGGRARVNGASINGLGRVVVKHYLRGGLLAYLIHNHFFFAEPLRPRQEFELLSTVRALGVRAPEPIAFAWERGFFYRAWLFTRELPPHQSLAELGMREHPKLDIYISEAVRQMEILISNHILHVDLHPGNVLVDDSGEVYVVDFDRAYPCTKSRGDLISHYLCRWRRAVIKHSLPDVLSEMLSHRLLSLAI